MSSKILRIKKKSISLVLSAVFLAIILPIAGSLTISAEVDSANLIEETDEDNLFLYNTGEIIETGTIGITFVPVYLEDDGLYGRAVEENLEFMKSAYPLPENKFVTRIIEEPRKPSLFGVPYEGTDPIDIQAIISSLWMEFRLASEDLVPDQNPVYPDNVIIGVVPSGFFGGKMNGVGSMVIRNTVLIEPGRTHVAAHEIGHVYELCEEYNDIAYWIESAAFGGCGNIFPPCHEIKIGSQMYCAGDRNTDGFWVSKGKPIYPFDREYFGSLETLQETKSGIETYNDADCTEITSASETYKMTCTFYYNNFMGVPTFNSEWVSNNTYNYLVSVFENSPELLMSTWLNSTSSKSLLVSGLVDKDGSISLDKLYVLDEENSEELTIGPYSLKLSDYNGTILLDQNFDVSFILLSDPPIDLNTTGFVFTVPFPEGTHKIQIDFNGETRAERLVSANAPSVSFLSPSGGEEWSVTSTVQWNASDADGDSLSFVLQYSTDDGSTWNPIAIDLNETRFELNAGYLQPTETCKLKVIATDGVLTSEAISDTFTVRNPDIDIQPWKIKLGEVRQGETASNEASIANTGNAALEITSYNTPDNITVSGLSVPSILQPGQTTTIQVDYDSTDLNGTIDQNISFNSNDPNEPQKHLFIQCNIIVPEPFSGTLHLTDMNSFIKEQSYYSGAATAKIITDYIRQSAGYPTISQDYLYNYGKFRKNPDNNQMLELDAKAMDAILGHFDPYDDIITDDFDSYDSIEDGNPYQGYNYTIDSYDNVNDYMRDIIHWMSYQVTREAWWLHGALVQHPQTPAALPIYGSYDHWVALNGYAVSADPTPDPYDPWTIRDFTVYGFWLTDPAINGIGQHVYVTAAETESTYFLPMTTNDAYNGKFLQVAEPPALPPENMGIKINTETNTQIEIAEPTTDFGNLEYIGIQAPTGTQKTSIISTATALNNQTAPIVEKNTSWRDLVDKYLLQDQQAVTAFEGASMAKPLLVDNLAGEDYYLVPYTKNGLTTGIIMLNAQDGHFEQATWTQQPETYLPISKQNALNLVWKQMQSESKQCLSNAASNRKACTSNCSTMKTKQKLSCTAQCTTNYLKDTAKCALTKKPSKAILAWQIGQYSQGPFKPYWVITANSSSWVVTQEGSIFKG